MSNSGSVLVLSTIPNENLDPLGTLLWLLQKHEIEALVRTEVARCDAHFPGRGRINARHDSASTTCVTIHRKHLGRDSPMRVVEWVATTFTETIPVQGDTKVRVR